MFVSGFFLRPNHLANVTFSMLWYYWSSFEEDWYNSFYWL